MHVSQKNFLLSYKDIGGLIILHRTVFQYQKVKNYNVIEKLYMLA
jgi:hypothetical protein